MADDIWWPEHYFASRQQFIEQARASGARVSHQAVAATGAGGEALSVDIATFASADDDHLLVLNSGLHGVEGFVGAAIQVEALKRLAWQGLPARTGLLLIHAANPWGFAHLRRVDAGNVDLNRNFINVPTARPLTHSRYAALDPVINPATALSWRSEIAYWLNAGRLIAGSRGIKALSAPIAQGQYDFPCGVFYGGEQLAESTQILQTLLLDHAAHAGRITILDLHTGLGPAGIATLIGNTNLVLPEHRLHWLRRQFRQPACLDDASDNAYNASGTFGGWCLHTLHDKPCTYLCVEIGTVNPLRVFSALRRENQAYHWNDEQSPARHRASQALLDVFAPRSQAWRKSSVAQGLQVLGRALDCPV